MIIIYDIAIFLYNIITRIASLLNPKAKLFVNGRKNLFSKLKQEINQHPGEYIWFHCASLGEFEQGRPLIELIKEKYPSYRVLVSFFSPSGYEVRKNYALADIVTYLPLDTRQNAQDFLSIVNPKVIFFVKYEFWIHFLNRINQLGLPCYLVSGTFRRNQIYFKWYGKMFFRTLKSFKTIFVQNESSSKLLLEQNISNVIVAGDTRFDRVLKISEQKIELDHIRIFCADQSIFVAGSSWEEDEKILYPIIESPLPFKYIIAPHEVHESHLTKIESSLQKPFIRYSQIRDTAILENIQVLIIDSIGLLSKIYSYGNYAYVGGAFGAGLHNILEAATFGMPIFFGPNYSKFNEAIELIQQNGAFSISNAEELKLLLEKFDSSPSIKKQTDNICKAYVRSKAGASKKVLSVCEQNNDL